MNEQEFFDGIAREIHAHLLTVETENGSALEDELDIDDLIDDIMEIFKNKINQYVENV